MKVEYKRTKLFFVEEKTWEQTRRVRVYIGRGWWPHPCLNPTQKIRARSVLAKGNSENKAEVILSMYPKMLGLGLAVM